MDIKYNNVPKHSREEKIMGSKINEIGRASCRERVYATV